MAPLLGYWKLRGLGQPIRLLLEYTGEEYDEKRYVLGDGPEFSRKEWLNDKNNLGLDFPNLPYLIDGNLKLTQSTAILQYFAEKHHMAGNTIEEKAFIVMINEEVKDFRTGFVRLCYNPNFENLKADYLANLPNSLKLFDDFLRNKKWLAGDKLTFPDFNLYDIIDSHTFLSPNCLDKFQNLREFCDRFQKLEPIEKYMKSKKYIRKPLNNKSASFGGDHD